MENLPETFYVDPTWGTPPITTAFAAARLSEPSPEELLLLLHRPSRREDALAVLVTKRETWEDLPLLLWNSFNTVFILLQEVMSAYKKLAPSKMTARESTRVCNAIALFQCIASHPQTRMEFVKAKITFYLHPFLAITANGDKPLELMRLTSLGVFGALVKSEDGDGKQIVHFLLKSEVFPMCLRCMDLGDELTQTVS
ncbi:unnamed protein product [Cuscuta campestris]|uniref:Uncharacterized protein n=1 Tax=Cuscuta campestris TaxID=132261 RepID=A0A484MM04_9ASTE|nr:unnamed protein product [Cuscuta campestris]